MERAGGVIGAIGSDLMIGEREKHALCGRLGNLDGDEVGDSEDEDNGEDPLRNALRQRAHSVPYVEKDELINMLLLPKRPNTDPGTRKLSRRKAHFQDDLLQILLPSNALTSGNTTIQNDFSGVSLSQDSDQTSLMENLETTIRIDHKQNSILKELNDKESGEDLKKYDEQIIIKEDSFQGETGKCVPKDMLDKWNSMKAHTPQDSDGDSITDEEIFQIDVNQFQSDLFNEDLRQKHIHEVTKRENLTNLTPFSIEILNPIMNNDPKQNSTQNDKEKSKRVHEIIEKSPPQEVKAEPKIQMRSEEQFEKKATKATEPEDIPRPNKRKSTLIKLCENQNRVPYRVGLSKRANVGHLHSYLRKK